MTHAESALPAAPARVAALSYFFPAHNEEANLEGLVQEALAALPALADRFEIIAVDDGSRDRTPQIADRLAADNPDLVRVVHHPINLGYGAALRSGFRAARYELVAFTDGDRQFRVADLGRLTARLASADAPDAVVGFRIRRADPVLRTPLQAGQPDPVRPPGPRRGLRLQAFPARGAGRPPRGVRRGVLFRGAAHQGPSGGPERRGGRRRPLPADGGLADGSEAIRRLARRQGLLGPAPAPLGCLLYTSPSPRD